MVLNGYVPIERGAADSVRRMMARCRELLREGSPVLIFPEGTRSERRGAAALQGRRLRLAMDAGVPVIPVALSGTHETLPKHGIVLRNRMKAVVQVLEPIDPSRYETASALRDAARSAIARALEGR